MRSGSVVAKQQLEIINLLESNFSSSYQQAFSKPNFLPQWSFNAISRLADIQAQINEGTDIFHLNYITGGIQLLPNKKYRRELKQAQEVIDEEDLQAANPITGVIKKDNAKKHFLTFLYRLRQANTWEVIRKQAGSKQKTMRSLKREWKKAGDYAHFTSKALFNAIDLLSQLKQLIDLAIKELNVYKKRIIRTEYDQYYAYLQNYKALIKKQQKKIANNLFYRVELDFINQDKTQLDYSYHLMQRFRQMGWLSSEFLANMEAIQSEKEAIDYPLAISFILKHSTVREAKVEKLAKLPSYFGKTYTLQSKPIDNTFCVIPDTLIPYIPNKRPAWYLRGQRARYLFFKNKTDILKKFISIRYGSRKIPSLDELSSHGQWNKLSALSKEIGLLRLEAIQRRKKSSSFFFRRSRQFYQVWESILIDSGCMVLKEKIDLLEKVVNQPASINELFSKPSMDAKTNREIMLQLEAIEQNTMFSQLKDEDQIRFKDIKDKIEVKCQRNNELEAVDIGLQSLAANIPLISKEFKQLFRFLFNRNSEENLKKFYRHHIDHLTQIFVSVENVLKSDKNFIILLSTENINLLAQQIKIIEIFSQLEEVRETNLVIQIEPLLDNFIQQYNGFLYSAISVDLKQKEGLLVKLEKAINHLLALIPSWQPKLEAFLLLKQDRLALQNGETPLRGDKELSEASKSLTERLSAIESRRKERQNEGVKAGINQVRVTQQPMSFHFHLRNQEVNINDILINRESDHQHLEAELKRIREERHERTQGLARMLNK